MRSLAVILVASFASLASAGVDESMRVKMDKYNLYATCFGPEAVAQYYGGIVAACKECMDTEYAIDTALTLPANLVASRRRRQADEFDAFKFTEEELQELQIHAQEHVGEMLTKMSNLTCVLNKLQMIDDEGQINMEHFSYDMVKEYLKETVAGKDDDFVQAMARGYGDCKSISDDWPQTTLDRSPLLKAYGRQKVFLKCMFKLEESMCYKFQMYSGMKYFFGFDPEVTDLGLPGNKFETSVNAMRILMETAEPEMKFIDDFFWSRWARM